MFDVAKIADDFGWYLKKMLAERGANAPAVSTEVGRNPDYIPDWIRTARLVNKSVLHDVCNALDLTDAERHQLFALADKRNLPDGAQRSWTSEEQIQLNVHHVLAELPHELPEGIKAEVLDLGDAVGWLLAWSAAGGVAGCEYTDLQWPSFFETHKIIVRDAAFHPVTVGSVPIPDELVSEYLADLDAIKSIDEDTARRLAVGLADVYRRWLLSDLDRCRLAAKGLKRWSLDRSPGNGLIVSCVFADVDAHDLFGVDRVSCNVVESVARRELAAYLWESANRRGRNDSLRSYPYASGDLENQALSTLVLAHVRQQNGKGMTGLLAGGARNAKYIVESPAWGVPPIDYEMFALYAVLVKGIPESKLEGHTEESLARMIDSWRRGIVKQLRDALDDTTTTDDDAKPARRPSPASKQKRVDRNASRKSKKAKRTATRKGKKKSK